MIGTISEYEERYDLEINDEALSEGWKRFGSDKHHCVLNRRNYEKWLECGFNGEPEFGRYGWLKNGRNIEASDTLPLWDDSYIDSTQLPNGKWICGTHCGWSFGGFYSSLCVWSEQYDTKIKAVTAALRFLLRQLREERTDREKEHIAEVVRALDDIRQLNLF